MHNNPNVIRYTYDLGKDPLCFEINTEPHALQDLTPPTDASQDYPDWTVLEKNQCACCPLKTLNHTHCPAAVRMHTVLETFKGFASIEQVELTVETNRRTYKQNCDMQSGLNSMLGLQMATSGCPVLANLRSMATFHMPFASFEETLFRSVSTYLMTQYFVHKEGGTPDWDLAGLKDFYLELESLNEAFALRIKAIEQNDAISNAIVMFFSASMIVASLIEEGMEEYKDYFTGVSNVPPYS